MSHARHQRPHHRSHMSQATSACACFSHPRDAIKRIRREGGGEGDSSRTIAALFFGLARHQTPVASSFLPLFARDARRVRIVERTAAALFIRHSLLRRRVQVIRTRRKLLPRCDILPHRSVRAERIHLGYLVGNAKLPS